MAKLSGYEHLVRALVYADAPEKQVRVTEEARTRSTAIRMAMISGYSFVYSHPTLVKRALAYPYQRRGIDVLGFGRNSTVIRQGEVVVKLARASEQMSGDQQRELVYELRRRHGISRNYLGEPCLDQEFDIITHPLRGTRVVGSRQPFVAFEPFKPSAAPEQRHAAVLADFALRSERMDEETGLVSDVSGTDNLGFTVHDDLVMVDTIPLEARDGGASVALAREIISNLASGF